jgi:hypothetical protein
MDAHAQLIRLIVAYTMTGALVFTVVITCFSLVGWIEFADRSQQNKLFGVLIVELVILSVGFFGGILKFDPQDISRKFAEVEQYKTLSNGLSKYLFATEMLHEFLSNNWTTKSSMISSVTEYNAAITDLRSNEATSLQLIQIHPDKTKQNQFKEIMETVDKIDKIVHSLNDEFEKVAILGTQKKISPERSIAVADQLRPLLAELKTRVNRLLTL